MNSNVRDPNRPDPDALLARMQAADEHSHRGHLKVFFGASPGVGKTYAMLSAARRLQEDNIDVIVGVIETHGRSETAALLAGLEVLPLREVVQRERTIKEFDLDAALARHPALILVDELAHTNAAGSRHPKRWQDVEELLDNGIDVYTTVNVQHIESLNDVVGGITGIRVWETVPDSVFDEADEILLVDLPADELLQRLKDGKVYLPEQAERAIQNFFRKGNLMALRELALRRTADIVDDDMRAYRADRAVSSVWHAREALLACIGPAAGSEKVVRSAARLAGQLNIGWHAIYVETPALQRLPETERSRILKILKLAETLGAKTATLPAQNAAEAALDYARNHNLTKIVVGSYFQTSPQTWKKWLRLFAEPFVDQLRRQSPDIDVIAVAYEHKASAAPSSARVSNMHSHIRPDWKGFAWAAIATVITTLIATPLLPYLDLANIVMLFLFAVVLIAFRYGRNPAIFAATLNVIAFDFFFVPPRFSFAITDAQYLITFAVLLLIGLMIAHLAAGLQYQAMVAAHREQRSRDLYEMARSLSAALADEQIVEAADHVIEQSFRAKAQLLLPDSQNKLCEPTNEDSAQKIDIAIAQWVFDRAEPAGIGTDTLSASAILYLPLKAPMRTRGVLVIEPDNTRLLMIPEQRRQLETFAALIAIALERVHFVTVAREATVQIEGERLRNSLLSALSHDLRTPLTAMRGAAETLKLGGANLHTEQLAMVESILDQAERTGELVENILDMARLESGELRLRKEWQSLEEMIGSALKARTQVLSGHDIKTDLPADLPLVECDATLIERVLVNLLENAAKYTPAHSTIRISAQILSNKIHGDEICISVADNGPGLPKGKESTIFDKFVRGKNESAIPGLGLGLAICRTIVEVHGGKIHAENQSAGGAIFSFTLPAGIPPEIRPEHT